jgi:K+-transporting ATPase ATPase C chain
MTISRVVSLDQSGGGWLGALRFAVVAIVLIGLAFPLFATALGQALFPTQAHGSLIVRDGAPVGSSLVAQPFAADKYFQPRPSAASFDPRAMSGSNWAPSNPALRERIAASSEAIATREGVAASAIPVDLVTASGSGIDPHISPAAARLQAARVAKARGMDVAEVQALIAANTQAPTFGILGQSRVNVLELNLALDAHAH